MRYTYYSVFIVDLLPLFLPASLPEELRATSGSRVEFALCQALETLDDGRPNEEISTMLEAEHEVETRREGFIVSFGRYLFHAFRFIEIGTTERERDFFSRLKSFSVFAAAITERHPTCVV